MNLKDLFKPLAKSYEVSALSYALQQGGMPKDQADIYAQQQILKQQPIQMRAGTGFGNLLTPMNLILGGLVVVGVVFIVKGRSSKRR